jgi:hypothetical protein
MPAARESLTNLACRGTMALGLVLALAWASASEAGEALRFKGNDAGPFSVTSPPGSPVAATVDHTTGHSPELGAYLVVAQESVDLGSLEVRDGSFTIITAGGDTITGTYSGSAGLTAEPTVITYKVSGPITGGTGRFAEATGRITFRGVADLSTGLLSETVTGSISKRGRDE